MSRSLKSLMLAGAVSLSAFVAGPAALGAEACPNEQLRIENHSTALPDCRAYELVSPDSNHAEMFAGQAAADGEALVYQSWDAPEHASSGLAVTNFVRNMRNSAAGWSGVSLTPPLPAPNTAYASVSQRAISLDLTSTLDFSDQPLSGPSTPLGLNAFLDRPDGTHTLLTTGGTPSAFNSYAQGNFLGGTPDFSHVYFTTYVAQSPGDTAAGNGFFSYGWSAEHGLHAIAILPNGTQAPDGGAFVGVSDNGRYVAFTSEGWLYLRTDETQTVQVGAVAIEPGNQRTTDQAFLTSDGSKVLFTSRTVQTTDANPAGKDLYSYNVATGELSDLTVDRNPADAATGADVARVLGTTGDGAYIYFAARGMLAPGATKGDTSLYVSHDGTIEFLAKADGAFFSDGVPRRTYLTPNGRQLSFESTDDLTGYDNTDPETGEAHTEVFLASLGSRVVCTSCRPDHTRPTGNGTLSGSTIPGGGPLRAVSDDGRRVFFQSTDAVVPQAATGLETVYEYSDGTPKPISPVDSSTPARFVGADATGNNAFFTSYAEPVANPNAGDDAVLDARVGGGFPAAVSTRCSGSNCHGPASTGPMLPAVGSAADLGGTDPNGVVLGLGARKGVTVLRAKKIAGSTGSLIVQLPGAGDLKVAGPGLKTARMSVTRGGAVTVRAALTPAMGKNLRRTGSVQIKVTVTFKATDGHVSRATRLLRFQAKRDRKGR